ncbi:hypothetical protein M7I_1197 [Glarea lozoyensis 74030]|uniref:RED-like N-terminal domain-containing protein n=1 Tax=Glarea lozoyensis (strain ATCC 74030 / MF5533) TaxID=1104152 RepID=H0EFC5_GLAL7|nr:hypothetical protein M7I_1197 [Glarea lozoyensis 74030]
MTPRNVKGYSSSNDFARQLAAQNRPKAQSKKFRSTTAPKGAKLPEGYVDRARARGGDDAVEGSEKFQRVKALEEMMKLQQIDEPTFLRLREEILGDDVKERAGLVKGLDFRLLERARRGEVGVLDVLEGKGTEEGDGDGEGDEEIDDEFDRLEEREVEKVEREVVKKRGEMAPPSLTGKRNRDQILAELKAARLAAKEAAQPSLGSRFKKVGDRRPETRLEKDSKGRDVLITVDEHGNEKRKVRKAVLPTEEKGSGLLMPDKDAAPLGMEVPEIPKPVEEEKEDLDIFDDAGDDYDPLADLNDDTSDEEEKEDGELDDSEPKPTSKPTPTDPTPTDTQTMPPPPSKPKNYFNDPTPSTSLDPSRPAALSDPTILAAEFFRRWGAPVADEAAAAKEAKRKRMLQQDDRDAQDMDLGFGSSRFGDQEEGEEGDGKRVKLSEWGKDDGDEEGGGGKNGKGARKRGGKKRKGDKDSVKDVLGVLERRKGEK